MSQLRAAHASDDTIQSGVDVIAGRVGSMQELGIFEGLQGDGLCLELSPPV